MVVRLATVAPDLVEVLRLQPPRRLRTIAEDVSDWIASQVQLDDPRIGDGLEALRDGRLGDTPERGAVKALAEELDDHAWNVEDHLGAGRARQDDYLAAFALARAAWSVWAALDDDPLDAAVEAAYEAQAATGNLAEVRGRIKVLTVGL